MERKDLQKVSFEARKGKGRRLREGKIDENSGRKADPVLFLGESAAEGRGSAIRRRENRKKSCVRCINSPAASQSGDSGPGRT